MKNLIITKVRMPESQYYCKCPYWMSPTRIAIHNTANKASAMSEISYMISNSNYTSFHFAVDYERAVQGIELNRNSFSTGDGADGVGNRQAIAIEICYSTGTEAEFLASEDNGALLTAILLNDYNWGMDKVTKHQDYSGKYCPHRTLDLGWQRYLNKVSYYKNGGAETPEVTPPTPETPSTPDTSGLKVGDWVGVKAGAKDYNGNAANGVLRGVVNYTLDELKGDRAVLDIPGICTAFHTADLFKANTPVAPTPPPVVSSDIKVGDWVGVKGGARDYNGNLAGGVKRDIIYYTADEIKGDRVVLDIPGICTAFRMQDLFKNGIVTPTPPPKPDTPTTSSGIKVGDMVGVKAGAKDYNGNAAGGVTRNSICYRVDELKNDRAVLDITGICTAFSTSNLYKTGSATPTPPPVATSSPIKVGDMVAVKAGAKDYNGNNAGGVTRDSKCYRVDELKGDRAVLDITGICTAFSTSNLYK